MANKALINYYAKLVHRNDLTMEQVPPDFREDVQKVLDTFSPLEKGADDIVSDKIDKAIAEDNCDGDCKHCDKSETCRDNDLLM